MASIRPARASKAGDVHGVFAWSRNPIYLGDLLLLATCLGSGANRWVCAVADVRAMDLNNPSDPARGSAHAVVLAMTTGNIRHRCGDGFKRERQRPLRGTLTWFVGGIGRCDIRAGDGAAEQAWFYRRRLAAAGVVAPR